MTPSEERTAPQAPAHFSFDAADNPESLSHKRSQNGDTGSYNEDGQITESSSVQAARPKLLPRETGHDIGMGSPVPLSAEVVGIITRLRNMKVCQPGCYL